MNYKRAIGIGILIYLASMIIGMVVCTMLGITPDMSQPIPMEMWITSAVLAIVLSKAGTYWYFMGKNLTPSLHAGLRFGSVVIIVGFILDILFFLSLSFEGHDPIAVMANYYTQSLFWVTIVLVLLGSGSMGWWLEKNKKGNSKK